MNFRKSVENFQVSLKSDKNGGILTWFSWNLKMMNFRKSVENFQVSLKSDKNGGILTFLVISRSVILRMRFVWGKGCRENQNTHFVSSKFFFFPEYCDVSEIMWKDIVERVRSQTICSMSIVCWITKATHTHSKYAILVASTLQKLLQERASILRYTRGYW